MKNLYLLPTDKPTRLYRARTFGYGFYKEPKVYTYKNQGQNIYITSDEEIKEGDWYYDCGDVNFICKAFKHTTQQYQRVKIILTTDQDLIKNGVQAIDDEFLEWFVKNPSCEEVEVKQEKYLVCNHCNNLHSTKGDGVYCDVCRKQSFPSLKTLYNIVIPQEEPKQEKILCKYCLSTTTCCDDIEAETCENIPKEEPKIEWKPKQGEKVWIKVFSNWSLGKYIGYDVDKEIHLVREPEEGGGNLFSSENILPYSDMPNEPKQEIEKQIALNEMLGRKIVKYLDKYKGQTVYNEIILAVQFGYHLKLEENE